MSVDSAGPGISLTALAALFVLLAAGLILATSFLVDYPVPVLAAAWLIALAGLLTVTDPDQSVPGGLARTTPRPVVAEGDGQQPVGPWRTLDTVEFATAEWVDWFNHKRLYEYCGDIPPVDREEHYYAQQQAQLIAELSHQ